MNILYVNPTAPKAFSPETIQKALQSSWNLTRSDFEQAAHCVAREHVDAVIVHPPTAASTREQPAYQNLMRLVESRCIATLVLSDGRTAAREARLVEHVGTDISSAELRGRLAMIDCYQGVVRRLEQELSNMERLSKRLNLHFRDIDQEMRLAGRLQKDFLPDTRLPIGNLRLASVFRPASWVSGDMFDIFRIDESQSGIYIADAVGHGMAAGLLTMFIKRAIIPKRIDSGGYKVISPSEVIASLNDALAEQSLPQCQFVTACYGLFDHEACAMEYARGGHPYPILISQEGIVSEIKAQGGLLGLFKGQQFPSNRIQLRPGDKFIFYTDGIELGFGEAAREASVCLTHFFQQHASLPIRDLMHCVEEHLDQQDGSLHPQDDISLIGLEVVEG